MNLRIGLAQINTTVGDIEGNLKKIRASIYSAKEQKVSLLVFPELTISGYPPEDLLLKPSFISSCSNAVSSLANESDNISLLVGAPISSGGKLYNSAVFISENKIREMYFKRELPNYGVFDEKRYFTQGTSPLIIDINGSRFAVTICEDIWIPFGDVEKDLASASPCAVFNLSASPFYSGKLSERTERISRFARNVKSTVCYVNITGGQDELVFDGGSMVVAPTGEIISSANRFEEELLVAGIELAIENSNPAINEKITVVKADINCDESSKPVVTKKIINDDGLESIYKALTCCTGDYIRKNCFETALIGLSGGIDSALTACIAVEAIGNENVTGVSMPSRFNSSETKCDAKILAENLGIKFLEIPIEQIFMTYLSELKEPFGEGDSGLAVENLQARIRGNILMALSNKFNSIVLTTGNKSEIAMGYCTLYGDTAGGFGVLKDLYREMVYKLSNFVNEKFGKEIIPKSIIQRAPSAELRDGQKDEDSLPPYPVLDPILKLYIEDNCPIERIAFLLNHDVEFVRKISKTVDRNEYKRRQAPPGAKITPRAFGKDHRMPMTNKFGD